MHALAQRFAANASSFAKAKLCARLAIWLDKALDSIDALDFLVAPDNTIVIPPQFEELAWEIGEIGGGVPTATYDNLDEVCLRLAVAAGSHGALLALGDAALVRLNIYQALDCYGQLIGVNEPWVRVRALYGAANAHMALAEDALAEDPAEMWALALGQLQAAAAEPESSFSRQQVTDLLNALTARMVEAKTQAVGPANEPLEGLG